MYNMYWKYIPNSTNSFFFGLFCFFENLWFLCFLKFHPQLCYFVDFVGGLICRYGEKGGKEKHRSFCHMTLHELGFSHGNNQQNVNGLAWKRMQHGVQNNLPYETLFDSSMPYGQHWPNWNPFCSNHWRKNLGKQRFKTHSSIKGEG